MPVRQGTPARPEAAEKEAHPRSTGPKYRETRSALPLYYTLACSMQNASTVACANKEKNDLKVVRAFRRRWEKNLKYLMRENCLRCDLCAIESMSMNSARARIPCAARRRPLEAMAELEKFPTLVYPKPALKRCGFCRSWPSVLSLSLSILNVPVRP